MLIVQTYQVVAIGYRILGRIMSVVTVGIFVGAAVAELMARRRIEKKGGASGPRLDPGADRPANPKPLEIPGVEAKANP